MFFTVDIVERCMHSNLACRACDTILRLSLSLVFPRLLLTLCVFFFQSSSSCVVYAVFPCSSFTEPSFVATCFLSPIPYLLLILFYSHPFLGATCYTPIFLTLPLSSHRMSSPDPTDSVSFSLTPPPFSCLPDLLISPSPPVSCRTGSAAGNVGVAIHCRYLHVTGMIMLLVTALNSG